MCMRYFIGSGLAELMELIEQAQNSATAERFLKRYSKTLKTSGDIRPTDVCPVVAPDSKGNKAVFAMKWGYTLPGNKQPLFNARVETAAVKPTFAESWTRRRCAVPASCYYEWKHYKTPDGKDRTGDKYLIHSKDDPITWLCGLYRIEDDIPVFTILTCEPCARLSEIHDRMPLILPETKIDEWITPSANPDTLLPHSLTDMVMEPCLSD